MKVRMYVIAGLVVALSACGGSSKDSAASGTHASVVPAQSSVAANWPKVWCQAQPGMTKDAIVKLMGPPTLQGDDFLNWRWHDYLFSASLANDGSVRLLEIGGVPTPAERAAVQCDDVRQ